MQLKELLEEVGLELDEVIGVIKFGSRVKGYFHESSDEDILVIVRSDKGGVYQKEDIF